MFREKWGTICIHFSQKILLYRAKFTTNILYYRAKTDINILYFRLTCLVNPYNIRIYRGEYDV